LHAERATLEGRVNADRRALAHAREVHDHFAQVARAAERPLEKTHAEDIAASWARRVRLIERELRKLEQKKKERPDAAVTTPARTGPKGTV
jgi:hypothetical protein